MFGINIIDDASVAASGLSNAKIAQIKASIEASAEAWGRYIDAPNAVIDINLTIDDIPGVALATAGAFFSSSNGGPFESVVTDELAANADLNPGSADGQLRIDLPNLMDPDFYFFDTSFEADPAGLANDEIDFMSVMVHELGHVLGLTIAGNFETPFASMTQVIGGINYFTGANAVAANGGNNVELTGSHLVTEDLLDPTTVSGTRGLITPVHIGIWQDLGVPIVEASSGADTLYGFEAFDDVISSNGGDDVVYGLTGDDTLNGGGGDDTLHGGDGEDELNGGNDDDTLNGGDGDDVLMGGAGADYFDGGADSDTIDYSGSSAAVEARLSGSRTFAGGDATGDSFKNGTIENLTGSDFDDNLVGNGKVNVLISGDGADVIGAGAGNDEIDAGGGNDEIIGGAGQDMIDGGAGIDLARYTGSATAVRVDLEAGTGTTGQALGDTLVNIENLWGSQHDDILTGNGEDNDLRGFDGNDTFTGGAGTNILTGNAGDDVFIGGTGNDFFNGGSGSDTIDYSDSVDGVEARLSGSRTFDGGFATGDSFSGIENLIGSDEDDILVGSGSVNILEAGRGDDMVTGGNGADTFAFRNGWGTDTITDFEDGSDILDFTNASSVDALSDVTIANDGNGDAVITRAGNSITLVGVDESDITAADFLF